MEHKCEIYHQEAQPVLSIRKRTSVENLPQILGEAFASIGQYLEKLGQQPGGAPFAAYYNLDMQDLDVEIGFPVSQIVPGNSEINATEMPRGYYATVFHKGPYSESVAAYESLTKFVKDQGRTPTGVAYEFYLNSPMDVSQEELKTQIVFPLQSEN
jgi:effector-binding domain-containing protein